MRIAMRSLLIAVLLSTNSFGWIYPEHRDIALLAIQKLSPENRVKLDSLWAVARTGYENRLTTSVIDVTQTVKPAQLDFASWTAIAGDHSCSPENLLHNVLQTDWILNVADIAAALKINLVAAEKRSAHINAIRDSDIRLQRADPEYATRAGSNNVHFLLARPNVNSTVLEYLTACLTHGTELNALGAYSWFHVSALEKAGRYASENLTAGEKSALILAALADEAFALHFLEDVFAAGHTAGTWGDASQRKGTHDFYNEKGLEVVTWDGQRMILMGDAFMRPADGEMAAATIRLSIEQLLNMASGTNKYDFKKDNMAMSNKPDSLNVCQNVLMPSRTIDEKLFEPLREVLIKTPVPSLATGLGEMPRFRAELGPFIGISAALNAGYIDGGFGTEQTQGGVVGGLEANIRFGLGLDGVLNEAGDGLVFLQLGWRQDAASSNRFVNSDPSFPANSFTSAIPGRSAYSARLRLPFWLLPGDLILAAPLLLFSPQTYAKMAVTAGNGGAIPWQSGIATGIGRFQFVLGREIGVSLFGTGGTEDAILVPLSNGKSYLLTYRSTKLDFPVLEYSPFKTFSQDQSSGILVQFTAGVDIPFHTSVILPEGATAPELKSVWLFGINVLFNWRHYIGTK